MKYRILHVERLDSTNNRIIDLFRDGEPQEGLVLRADEQTAGRGYSGNHWESEKGKNLIFSLVLKPSNILPARQFVLTQLVSIALVNTLTKHLSGHPVWIKWPNDVYVGAKKIAGILIQHTLKENTIDYTIVGVGLNVNQEKFISNAPNPVSMAILTNRQYKIEELLDELLSEINLIYANMSSMSYHEELNENYLQHLYGYKKELTFREANSTFSAIIMGLGEYGRLKLKKRDGSIVQYDFKQVEFLVN